MMSSDRDLHNLTFLFRNREWTSEEQDEADREIGDFKYDCDKDDGNTDPPQEHCYGEHGV